MIYKSLKTFSVNELKISKCYLKSPTPQLNGYFSVNYSPSIIMLRPCGQSPLQREINAMHLLIGNHSGPVFVANHLLPLALGTLIPTHSVVKALTPSPSSTPNTFGTPSLWLCWFCGASCLKLWEKTGPIIYHQERNKDLPAKPLWFWRLRGLCSEKPDTKAKVCTHALVLLAWSSLQPLPAPDTCQTTVPQRWDCKPLRVQKSH